jgi:hypothetical protein
MVSSTKQDKRLRKTLTIAMAHSSDDTVAIATSTPGLEINLAWGLFRDRGSEDGEERIHYWLFEVKKSCL